MQMEPRRRRCSLLHVIVGVVLFALVVFASNHGMLQSLHAAEGELAHLGHMMHRREHFVRVPTDGADVLIAAAKGVAEPDDERPVEAVAATDERPVEVRPAAPAEEDDGVLRARRTVEVHGRAERGNPDLPKPKLVDPGAHAAVLGYAKEDFGAEDYDPHQPADLRKHFEETAVLWARVARELDTLPLPFFEEDDCLYDKHYDPLNFGEIPLANRTYTPPPGIVVTSKRVFDNAGPNVAESLRMLGGGAPAPELREFPNVLAKRKRGEKAYVDDDDEAGGASVESAVDVGVKRRATPVAVRTPAPVAATPAPVAAPPKACASAIYWRAPSRARRTLRRRHASEATEKRYVTFEPDHGGWNNIRMGMETAALFAWSTGRILVLPAKARLYLVSKASKAHGPFDFYDLDLIRNSGGVTSTEAYLKERTGSPSVSGCGDEHLAAWKALHLKLRELAHTVLWKPRTDFLVLGSRFGAPDAETTKSLRRHAAGRKLVDVDKHSSSNATTIHFATDSKRDLRFLTHFYTFMRWARADLGRAARRVARDELRYRREIQCAAAEVIDVLSERAQGRNWTGIHVRRGDFQFTEAKVDAQAVLKAVEGVAQDTLIYVATDERKRAFFAPLRDKYDLVFLDDLATEGSLLKAALDEDPNWAGMVEQLICGAAPVFLGTWWSTFTGYITRIRGYRGLRASTFYVLPKYRDAFVGPSKPVGGAAWWREWPTGFEDIDDDHRLVQFAREMSGGEPPEE